MKRVNVEMYGPRLKVMTNGTSFCLIFDQFDEETNESKIVKMEIPRGQLEEWVPVFTALIQGS